MVLHKILDHYLSSYPIWTKYITGFGNNEVLKTLTFEDADADANADPNLVYMSVQNLMIITKAFFFFRQMKAKGHTKMSLIHEKILV